MDKKSLLLSKFRDSRLKIDPGDKVFLIHHDGSIVEKEVDYVFFNMDNSLSIYIDGEGEFLDGMEDICFFKTIEEAKSFRDNMFAQFAIFIKSNFGKYYSTFDSNFNFLMMGTIHPETLESTENFIDYLQDLDYLNESQYLFLSFIHNNGYLVPLTGFAVYYVSDGKSMEIKNPCLFKQPVSVVNKIPTKISKIKDPNKLRELFSEVFLTSADIFEF